MTNTNKWAAPNSLTDFNYLRHMKWLERHTTAYKEPVGVALFGVGRAGTIHFNNLFRNPGATLLYVVEYSSLRRKQLEETYHLSELGCNLVSAEEDEPLIFNDPRVNVVVVTTPTSSHGHYIELAARAKKHIFCEKPIGKTIDEIANGYDVALRNDVTLFCAFNRRFDPAFRYIRDRVVDGKVGDVHLIKTTIRDSPCPPLSFLLTSGGIYHDMCVHDLDVICWIMKAYPIRVVAYGSVLNPDLKEMDTVNDFDTTTIMLQFPGGQMATIDVSRNSNYGYDQRIEVFGSEGMLTAENPRVNGVTKESSAGVAGTAMFYSFASRYHDAYSNEMEYFLAVVRGEASNTEIVSKQEMLAVSKIASACMKSAQNGNVPIDITW